ncbi:MAG: FHA domain-containing protein, partial [Lentisphaerae bacterium]
MAKLILLNTERAGTEFALPKGKRIILGRNPDCDIILNNVAGISRHHAAFEYDEDKQGWVVRDLNSQNGIFLNKEKISEHLLQDGDALWFSTVRIRFSQEEAQANRHAYFAASDADQAPDQKDSADSEPVKSESAQTSPPKPSPSDDDTVREPKREDSAGSVSTFAEEEGALPVAPEKIAYVGELTRKIRREFSKIIVGQNDV